MRSSILMIIAALTGTCWGNQSNFTFLSCDLNLTNGCNCMFDQSLKSYNIYCEEISESTTKLLQDANVTEPITVHLLDLSSNKLSALSQDFFKGILNISILDLTNNSLQEIPPVLLTWNVSVIEDLRLANNKLTTLNTSKLNLFSAINRVNLSHNNIKVITGSTDSKIFPKVHTLDLSFNKIESLEGSVLQSLKGIHSLDLANNRIKELSIFPSMKMKHLNLSSNALSILPDGIFQEMSELKELDLSSNNVQRTPSGLFLGMKNLEKLRLSNNSITNMAPNILRNLPMLHALDLSHNKLTKLTSDEFSGKTILLKTLDLSHNDISGLDRYSFKGLQHLTSLLLAENRKLTTLYGVQLPPHLAFLDLTNCAITEIFECDIKPLVDLRFLHLQGNNLSCDCHMKWLLKWCEMAMDSNLLFQTKIENPWMCKINNTLHVITEVSEDQFVCEDPDHEKEFCDSHTQINSGNVDNSTNLPEEDIELRLNVTEESDTIISTWSVKPNHQLFGFRFTFSGSEEGEFISPWLHGNQRQYVMTDIVSYTNYNVCIIAYHNETVPIATTCKSLYIISNKVYVGIMAGTVAIIPCLIALAIVMFKDRYAPKYEVLQTENIPSVKKDLNLGQTSFVAAAVSPPNTDNKDISSTDKAIIHKTPSKPSINSKEIETYINQSFAFADETSYHSGKSVQDKTSVRNIDSLALPISVGDDKVILNTPPPLSPDLKCCDEQHENLSTKL